MSKPSAAKGVDSAHGRDATNQRRQWKRADAFRDSRPKGIKAEARRQAVGDQRGRHDGRVTVPKRPRPTPGRHVGSGGD